MTRNPKPGASPPPSLATSYTYDATFNKPTSITDPLGLVTTMSYNAGTGTLQSAVADQGSSPHFNATTRYTYNAVGQPLTVTDPLGVTTQFAYDSLGNRTSTVAGVGSLNQTTAYAYNTVGDVTSVTDPNSHITINTYDAARRLLTSTSPTTPAAPSGLATTLTYDDDNRVLQTQQSAGGSVLRTTSATYTVTGKQATATDANGNTTRYAYDALDRLSTTTDPLGRITRYTYDALSRPYQVFNSIVAGLIPGGALASQTYTADGLRASLTDANNNTTSFAYDRFDRLGTTTYPDSSTETLAYDADSNVTSRITRAGGTLLYGYDTLNRLATKTAAATPVACTAAPSSTPTVTYSYDLAGRVTGVCDNGSAIASIATPATSTSYTAAYSYDAVNRPIGVIYGDVPAATPSPRAAVSFTHGYNAVNQRISQTVSDNSWISYPSGPTTTGYTANNLNQYTCVGVTAPSCAGVVPTYDGNGNLTSDGTYTLGYDAENRLTSAAASSLTAAYAYDARGRRKAKTVNGTTTVFVTDADNREVMEYDGSTGAVLRWYAYGLGPNDVLAQATPGATSTRVTFVPDVQGSIIGSMTTAGALTSFAYQPYGSSSSSSAAFGYTGQRIDAETGLYYYRARSYSSVLGRFLQVDPIGFAGGSLLYAYTSNDPLNATDPFGWSSESWVQRFSNSALGIARDWAQDFADTPSRIGNDISRMAADFGESPALFFRKSSDAFVGLGMSIPALGVAGRAGAAVEAPSVLYSPINPGPLAEDIATTFRSGTYTGSTLSRDTTLYRVIADNGNPNGAFWTRTQPAGPLQSVIDLALDQNWRNTATTTITRTFPAGTQIFEGSAAMQRGLVGGGNQIYIPGLVP